MKLLAFDTSSKALSVAILEDETLLAETTLTIKKNHSITLMPVIDFLMRQIDLTPKDLDRIVVAEGPGSYTGLRIAVATAKTLAHTLGIELVGVSSLLALVPDDLEGLGLHFRKDGTARRQGAEDRARGVRKRQPPRHDGHAQRSDARRGAHQRTARHGRQAAENLLLFAALRVSAHFRALRQRRGTDAFFL